MIMTMRLLSKKLISTDYQLFQVSIIIIIAGVCRLIYLDKVPNGFFPDEASNAYDAYSILQTGRDQYGNFFPLVLKSANDYREGLYIYLMVPFIKLFGLTEFAARVPSAIIGTVTVLILYNIATLYFNQRAAFFSALLLAISPWHIQFSRIGFRAILFPCLFCLSLLFFLKSLQQPKYLPLMGFGFSVSLFTYPSARVFIPLFLIGLVLIFHDFFYENKVQSLLATGVFFLFLIPQLTFYLSSQGMTRANDVILSHDIVTMIKVYFSHFSPAFLFFQGDPNPRHLPQNRGELYYFEMLTLSLGILGLIQGKTREKLKLLLLWGLILFPLPAALTSEIHSIRAIIGAPLLAMISGYGVTQIPETLGIKKKKFINFIILLIMMVSFTFYSHRYFREYPRWFTTAWLSTIGEVITYANQTTYNCVVIDTNVYGEHIYILVPFYTQLDPNDYQKFKVDVATHHLDMGRWKVRNLNQLSSLDEKCLYLTSTQQLETLIPKGYDPQPLNHFRDINGDELYQLVKVRRIVK